MINNGLPSVNGSTADCGSASSGSNPEEAMFFPKIDFPPRFDLGFYRRTKCVSYITVYAGIRAVCTIRIKDD